MVPLLAYTSDELVIPNLHVVLIHYPLALLIVGVLIELLAFLWRRSSVRTAGRWMILIGALSMVPVITSGIYALYDATEVSGKTLSAVQYQHMSRHIYFVSGSTIVALLVVVAWLGSTETWRNRLHLAFLALMVVACCTMVVGSWYGGELVYGTALEVELTHTQKVQASIAMGTPSTAPTTLPADAAPPSTQFVSAAATKNSAFADYEKKYAEESANLQLSKTRSDPLVNVEKLFPPMQTHVIFAGLTAAIALAALGLSIRRMHGGPRLATASETEGVGDMGAIASALESRPEIADAIRERSESVLDAEAFVEGPPAGRWWMLTVFLAALTAIGGFWTLGSIIEDLTPAKIWNNINGEENRRMMHVIVGTSIIVLPLLLAIFVRFAPRKKLIISVFAVLLLAAIAFQVWLGVLLMFDGTGGSYINFEQHESFLPRT